LAQKSHSFVGQYKFIGMNLEFVIANWARALPRKVEVRVLGETQWSRLVCFRFRLYQQIVAFGD
jgi:hypothetical protein